MCIVFATFKMGLNKKIKSIPQIERRYEKQWCSNLVCMQFGRAFAFQHQQTIRFAIEMHWSNRLCSEKENNCISNEEVLPDTRVYRFVFGLENGQIVDSLFAFITHAWVGHWAISVRTIASNLTNDQFVYYRDYRTFDLAQCAHHMSWDLFYFFRSSLI